MRRHAARLVLTALTTILIVAIGASVVLTAAKPDHAVLTGAQWKLGPRMGGGEAVTADPARLLGISVQPHDGYDRLEFRFVGGRPGYRVSYSRDRRVLRVDLLPVAGAGYEGSQRMHSAAIEDIRQLPATAGMIRTEVTLVATSGDGLPFRVDLATGSLFVDIALPDAVVALMSVWPMRRTST
jgi:hypothetical protein